MGQLETRYGVLKGAEHIQYYPDGMVKQCTLLEANKIVTPFGIFTPQYLDDGYRRKRVKPLTFYHNGNIKNLPLQDGTLVQTKVGVISAELITWYENGSIRRIFPLDGSLTGFWTEDDEYKLAEPIEISLSFGKIKEKVVGVQFYECGNLKNITFWSKDKLAVATAFGNTDIRIGLEVYPDGALRAFEPAEPLLVDTLIGKIYAYNPKAIGIHSDNLSLRLARSGEVENVVTSKNMVKVVDKSGRVYSFKPELKPSMFNLGGMELFPLRITFNQSRIYFNNNSEYEFNVNECSFTVTSVSYPKTCSSCDGCSACG
jgi:antitoxin component YwqK of YwqJK toxin-antitoxin module